MLESFYGQSEAEVTGTVCLEKSLTRQSELAGCDVNVIMKRYEKTGELPMNARTAIYADVSEVGDYRTALQIVRDGEAAFMQLPAAVRAKFGNDVGAFLDFAADPANQEDLVQLGLVEAPKAPAPVEPAPEAPEGAAAGA